MTEPETRSKARLFLRRALAILDDLEEHNARELEDAGLEIAGRLAGGGRLLLFGCGHSGLVAQDAYYRAGGLRGARALFAEPTGLDRDPVEESSVAEKEAGWIASSLEDAEIGFRDALVVVSTSGVNAAPVDLALLGRERGAFVVAITSLGVSRKLSPRHPSGRKLHEVADQVLDNRSPWGDALVEVEAGRWMGSPSTAAGSLLVQALMVATWEQGSAQGVALPTWVSGNLPGGMERNREEGS